jgi:hypothetical protein
MTDGGLGGLKNCQERTYEELLSTLKVTLKEALELIDRMLYHSDIYPNKVRYIAPYKMHTHLVIPAKAGIYFGYRSNGFPPPFSRG